MCNLTVYLLLPGENPKYRGFQGKADLVLFLQVAAVITEGISQNFEAETTHLYRGTLIFQPTSRMAPLSAHSFQSESLIIRSIHSPNDEI